MRFSEVAFFHAASKTLLVTDAVVYVPEDPPEIIPRKSLLEIARDGWLSRWGGAGGRLAWQGGSACVGAVPSGNGQRWRWLTEWLV